MQDMTASVVSSGFIFVKRFNGLSEDGDSHKPQADASGDGGEGVGKALGDAEDEAHADEGTSRDD